MLGLEIFLCVIDDISDSLFILLSSCSSPVGYRYGRRNDISLGGGCQYLGTTMHEIGHSIGLYHEQSRPDRDRYVRIIWNNIQRSTAVVTKAYFA